MIKTFILWGFLLATSVVYSYSYQSDLDTVKFNSRNKKGQKHGHWITFGKDKPEKGFPADGKIEEGDYINGRKEGKWTAYHTDGKTPKLIGNYTNNRPEGSYKKLDENGLVYERGNFKQGKYQDSLKRYYPNGVLKFQTFFNENAKENGKVTYRYENGQIEFEYESINGVPTGRAIRYYENGDVKEIIQYSTDGSILSSEKKEMARPALKTQKIAPTKNMAPKIVNPKTKNGVSFQPNGYNKVYNSNEEIWQDGDFKNGRLWDGKVYKYDEDGILLKVKVYKKGVYHSDGQL